jgi:uncharacterized Tic20 family protein
MTDASQDTTTESTPGGSPSKEARTMAMLAHLLGIVTGFLGPLIIWLIKKDEEPFVDAQGKEALNFQITLTIVYIVCGATSCFIIPVFVALAAWVAALILAIMAGMKANEGISYQYPMTLRLIK